MKGGIRKIMSLGQNVVERRAGSFPTGKAWILLPSHG